MYYPYLYGRQAELNAATGLIQEFGAPQQIFPLLEPVNAGDKLTRAVQKVQDAGASVYVVVNPHQGDFRQETARAKWREQLARTLDDRSTVRPVLNELPTTGFDDIKQFLSDHDGLDAGVILNSSRIRPAELADLLEGRSVVVFVRSGANVAGYSAVLGASKIVEVCDNFNAQERNADYAGEEWLGNNHLTYLDAGHRGFSDFTVLPGKYESGGGPIGAAAIHLTYKNEDDNSFWVQHFISDETDRNVGNTSSKLLEALNHLKTQIDSTPNRFEQSPALNSYLEQLATGRPTNLPKSKELQISHHIFTVAKHLGI